VRPFPIGGEPANVAKYRDLLLSQDGEDSQTLLKNAEAAIREAKEQGGNGYRYFSAAMNEAALHNS